LGVILFGGCPQPQVPNQVSDTNQTTTTDTNSTTTTGGVRPIPPPPITDSNANQGDSGSGGSGGSGGSSGGGSTADYSIRFSAPLTPLGVRPGAKINVTYKLTDARGLVGSLELVLSYVDPNGQPTGDPMKVADLAVQTGTRTVQYDTQEAEDQGRLSAGGRNDVAAFLIGLRSRTTSGDQKIDYATGLLTIDAVAPTLVAWTDPNDDRLISPGTLSVRFETSDNTPHTVKILLDTDQNPDNSFAGILLNETTLEPNDPNGPVHTFNPTISINAGTYYYLVVLSDGVEPPTREYAGVKLPNNTTKTIQVMVTNRLVGTFDLNRLDPTDPNYDNGDSNDPYAPPSKGAILQGFNFNDLAGSSMVGVPDLNADGAGELLVVSRFGKPRLIQYQGVGFGEAYLFYGSAVSGSRLRKVVRLNTAGTSKPGITIAGIRTPVSANASNGASVKWTAGMSDVTVVPDMDGDGLPDLVFSFPRVESVSLGNRNPFIQHPELFPDRELGDMGEFDYDASEDVDGSEMSDVWTPNQAQFTSGGIVIVSSSTVTLKNPNRLNRKGARVVDLHEVGQMFDDMGASVIEVRAIDSVTSDQTAICVDPNDPNQVEEVDYEDVIILWDLIFRGQGPGGFMNQYTGSRYKTFDPFLDPQNRPPLANIRTSDITAYNLGFHAFLCPDDDCQYRGWWIDWGTDCYYSDPDGAPSMFAFCDPNVDPADPNLIICLGGGDLVWTGFYATSSAEVYPDSDSVGARIIGQTVDDRFGTALGADGNWLYISAPERTALKNGDNVPLLPGNRSKSGVVYQLSTNNRTPGYPTTMTQLWIEPQEIGGIDPNNPGDPNDPNYELVGRPLTWPHPDAQDPSLVAWLLDPNVELRKDWTMPVPHQYIIEDIGCIRGNDSWWGDLGWADPAPIPPENPDDFFQVRNLIYDWPGAGCADAAFEVGYSARVLGVPGLACNSPVYGNSGVYRVGTAAYYVDRVAQIVGPHPDARISFVRALGDLSDDGIRDFAVGSADINADGTGGAWTGPKVGGIFIVFGRGTSLEGDYLLDQLALDVGDPQRLRGVLLRGEGSGDRLARSFADAGDVNGDGLGDVIIGNEGANGDTGEAILLFGSRTLVSPQGGWTPSTIPASRIVRFKGIAPGDLAGANVSGADDVDDDGYADLLIAAPGENQRRGAVYLIYGSPSLPGVVELSELSPTKIDVVYAKFLGRATDDYLGGQPTAGLTVSATDPANGSTTVFSQGVVGMGDLDGDGKGDFALSAMLADPDGVVNAGEVYVIYGRGD
jgi:hypothetical protein